MSSTPALLTAQERTTIAMPRSPTPFGTLSKLPFEIRCMIYKTLFAAGVVNLIRASKALHQDTKESLGEHGVCRVTVGHHDNPRHMVKAQLPIIPFHMRNLIFHIVRRPNTSYWLGTRPCDLKDIFRRATGHLKKPKNLKLVFEIWEHDLYVIESMVVLPKFQTVNVELESHDRLNFSDSLFKDVVMRRARRVAEHIKDVLTKQYDSEEAPKLTVLCSLSCVAPEEWEHYLKNGAERVVSLE